MIDCNSGKYHLDFIEKVWEGEKILYSHFIRHTDLWGTLTFRQCDHSRGLTFCLLTAAYKNPVLSPRKNQIILHHQIFIIYILYVRHRTRLSVSKKIKTHALQIAHGKEYTHINTSAVEMFTTRGDSIYKSTGKSVEALRGNI